MISVVFSELFIQSLEIGTLPLLHKAWIELYHLLLPGEGDLSTSLGSPLARTLNIIHLLALCFVKLHFHSTTLLIFHILQIVFICCFLFAYYLDVTIFFVHFMSEVFYVLSISLAVLWCHHIYLTLPILSTNFALRWYIIQNQNLSSLFVARRKDF